MKRSEMIKLLTKEVEGHECYNEKESLICAKHILKVIEKAGMLPPPNEKALERTHGIDHHIYHYIWEPENA